MKTTMCLILLPLSLWAQEFPFCFEPDAIPVQISGWEPQCPWAPGMSESTPAFCDIDADGDFDFFTGDFQNSVHYYVNQGSAIAPDFLFITSAYASLFCLAGSSSSFDFGDLDNDGDFDICMGQGAGAVYWNTGSMSAPEFDPIPDTLRNTQGGLMVATHPELADIDADGDLDLIAGHYAGTLYFYRNIGTADSISFLFESSQWLGLDVGTYASPTFCDLDNDCDLDLFIGTGSGYVRYYRNDGTPQQYNFTLVSSYWLSLDVGDYASPEFCDIDGDGDLDLFVGCAQGDAYFYENIGTAVLFNFEYVTANYLTMDVGHDPIVQQVDIDADGDLDLMCATGTHIRYYQNIGTAQEPSYILEDQMFQNITLLDIMPYFCDIDADGDYDLVAGTSAIPGPPSLYLYQNRGTPQSPDLVLYSSAYVTGNFAVLISPALADIDADGDYDLFITDQDLNDTRDIWFYENTGSPSSPNLQFVTQTWQNIYLSVGTQRYQRFYDIDSDGDLDLFLKNNWNEPGGSNLRFYENVGTPQDPNMALITSSYLPLEVNDACAWFCDIDSDNLTDLFMGESNGGVLFFHGLADTSGWVMPPVQRHPQAGLQISLGPNPANPNTVISLTLPFAQEIDLAIYNLMGARVATLTSGLQAPGIYTLPWDASGNASGVYIIQLKTPAQTATQKLTIIK